MCSLRRRHDTPKPPSKSHLWYTWFDQIWGWKQRSKMKNLEGAWFVVLLKNENNSHQITRPPEFENRCYDQEEKRPFQVSWEIECPHQVRCGPQIRKVSKFSIIHSYVAFCILRQSAMEAPQWRRHKEPPKSCFSGSRTCCQRQPQLSQASNLIHQRKFSGNICATDIQKVSNSNVRQVQLHSDSNLGNVT